MKTIVATILLCLYASLAMAQTLTLEEQHKLDTFFSNFSEADLSSFGQDELSPNEMLYFALQHAMINSLDKLEQTPDGLWAKIPADLINKITKKYFNKDISEYLQPAYLYPLASGETYTFSQVNMINHMGENFYYADGPVYRAGSGSVIDPHGTPEQWQSEGEDVEQIGTFQATYEKTGNGYILLTYDYIPNPAEECPYLKLSSHAVLGEYMGTFENEGVTYISIGAEDGGDILDIRCNEPELYFGGEVGTQVEVLFIMVQFWNDATSSCETAPFFVWGTVL